MTDYGTAVGRTHDYGIVQRTPAQRASQNSRWEMTSEIAEIEPLYNASRLQEFSKCLGVPVSFFFEGLPSNSAKLKNAPADPAQQLLVTRDGLDLVKAFVSIDDKAMRRSIVTMVEEIANGKASTASTRRRIGA
jgi:hypothetical protein